MRSVITILSMLFIFSVIMKAQEKIAATFESSGSKIIITYELTGDPDQEYDVQIKLKRKSVPSFELIPVVLSGDFGHGKYAGGRRTVNWFLNSTETEQLDGDDFYFEVTASEINKGGSTWFYYVGGILLGGGAAAAVLMKKSPGSETESTTSSFPAPPGRP